MNEAFHRPNQIKIGSIATKKSSDSGSGLKKIHLQAKWRVMKNPDFSKNPDKKKTKNPTYQNRNSHILFYTMWHLLLALLCIALRRSP